METPSFDDDEFMADYESISYGVWGLLLSNTDLKAEEEHLSYLDLVNSSQWRNQLPLKCQVEEDNKNEREYWKENYLIELVQFVPSAPPFQTENLSSVTVNIPTVYSGKVYPPPYNPDVVKVMVTPGESGESFTFISFA